MIPPDPERSPRRAARAEAERLATAAVAVTPSVEPATRRRLRAESEAPSVRAPVGIRALLAVRGGTLTMRRRRAGVLVVALLIMATGAVAIGAAASAGGGEEAAQTATVDTASAFQGPPAVPAEGLPVPQLAAVPATATPCDDPAVTAALASRDDAAVISAIGGGSAFREAVASGIAPCVSLSDPNREWVVVNKQRPLDPLDYRAGDLVMPQNVRALEESALRSAPASVLTELVRAASDAGAGEIGFLSAFRSYATQQSTYAGRVDVGGVEEADRESARAGYSEHQTGLAVDIVPCDGSCGTLDDIASSPQGAWVRDHAWEYGFITRYAEGRESVSGYLPEAWHQRYIGRDLARAYHEGGYTTLEEFFGLPAAPTY
ncbi:M15 family metallopeptidase [Microbacterium proteolyticum]|uniref:M15 family metallopeptidase n=1 Tax=Microbacterium proteolyticum TaxID=1572644 RepID=UPI001FACE5A1|nr:M15 family metallopeptidase [Microbacterium proteolyticum]MCI9859121.1 M15 family metallopeptidase [Microbacterium proteolyticum]